MKLTESVLRYCPDAIIVCGREVGYHFVKSTTGYFDAVEEPAGYDGIDNS